MFGLSAKEVYAVGSPDVGDTLESVWGTPGALVIAGFTAQNTGVLLGGDGQGQWSAINQNITPADVLGMSAADASHLFAVGQGGQILFSSGAGTWSAQDSGTQEDLEAVFAASPTAVWAVGGTNAATIVKSTGNGKWTTETPPDPNAFLYGVWGSSATDLYAVGAGGAILHSTGDGQWAAQTSGTMNSLHAVWGSSANDVWVVGTNMILHSTGNGKWTAEKMAPMASLWGITGRAGDLWAVGSATVNNSNVGVVYRSHGDGCWAAVKIPASPPLWSIWSNGTDLLVVGCHTDQNGCPLAPGALLHGAGGDFTAEPYFGGQAMSAPGLFAVGGAARPYVAGAAADIWAQQ